MASEGASPWRAVRLFSSPLEMEAYDPSVYCPVYLEEPLNQLVSLYRARSGERWRVDAGAWVAARKAAARVRAGPGAATNPVVVP